MLTLLNTNIVFYNTDLNAVNSPILQIGAEDKAKFLLLVS
jgi:hypothetical protein